MKVAAEAGAMANGGVAAMETATVVEMAEVFERWLLQELR